MPRVTKVTTSAADVYPVIPPSLSNPRNFILLVSYLLANPQDDQVLKLLLDHLPDPPSRTFIEEFLK